MDVVSNQSLEFHGLASKVAVRLRHVLQTDDHDAWARQGFALFLSLLLEDCEMDNDTWCRLL